MNPTLTCAFSQWGPGLGDNNVVGWLTVAVYLAAAAAGVRVARFRARVDGGSRETTFWIVASSLMLLLAINKQLDLQSLVTVIGRCHAQLHGWYEDRRAVQEAFILAVVISGMAGLLGLAILLRGVAARVWGALLGLGFVCSFVFIRAASFHHVDALIGKTAVGLKLNWLLELPGPLLFLGFSLWAVPRSKSGS